MEPTMINLKVLSTAAIMALVLPMVAPAESFAQQPPKGARAGGPPGRVGGGPPRVGGGGPRFNGGGGGPGPRFGGGGGGGGGGFLPGLAAGAIIGGAIAAPGYGPGPGYYAPGYDDGQYDDPGVAVVPGAVGGDVAYCMQTYRSYDPRSGTYMGTDGYRHPCP
jgi:hypothetical protein